MASARVIRMIRNVCDVFMWLQANILLFVVLRWNSLQKYQRRSITWQYHKIAIALCLIRSYHITFKSELNNLQTRIHYISVRLIDIWNRKTNVDRIYQRKLFRHRQYIDIEPIGLIKVLRPCYIMFVCIIVLYEDWT